MTWAEALMVPVMTASDRFRYVPPTSDTIPVFEEVRACFINLVDELDELLPEGREKALALTKLEEALSWANSAVARTPKPAFCIAPTVTVTAVETHPITREYIEDLRRDGVSASTLAVLEERCSDEYKATLAAVRAKRFPASDCS